LEKGECLWRTCTVLFKIRIHNRYKEMKENDKRLVRE
jgi:hypothetical protein